MLREAHSTWRGGPYSGKGTVSTASGALTNTGYTFGTAPADGPITTPCELLAAAIASCMSIMLAHEMAKAGMKPAAIDTHAALTLNDTADQWRIIGAHLTIIARTADHESNVFQQAVESARRACPIWRALRLDGTCEARLISLAAPAFI